MIPLQFFLSTEFIGLQNIFSLCYFKNFFWINSDENYFNEDSKCEKLFLSIILRKRREIRKWFAKAPL